MSTLYRERRNSQKFISLVVATIAAGIPISTASAHQLNFADPLFLGQWILLGVIGSFATFLYFSIKLRDIIGTFTLGYMLAVILRFVSDILINNVTHSNLSISLMISMAVGAFSGWLGSTLWLLMRRKSK